MTTTRVLIVAATSAEAGAVRDVIGDSREVDVLVCGVGKSAAATATALRLAGGGVDAVVSFGVAGAYPQSGLALADVVVATEVAVVDEGLAGPSGFTPFARPDMEVPGAAWTPACPRLRSALTVGTDVRTGRIATVSVCAGTEELARARAAAGSLCEAMEGAAVALVAARYDVPFAEVRGISNHCGPRDGAPFELDAAVRNAAAALRGLATARRTDS